MSRLPDLHRQLVRAAREQESRERELDWLRIPARRLLLTLCIAGVALASTTIALAASGVIPIGSPVPPDRHLRADVGLGLPEPGASKLLPMRVSDPEGGPPWGMRIIRTSREEVCLQIGRVQDGELGVLGVDGAFKDDGEFHPLPLDSLPARDPEVVGGFINTTTSCFLSGQAFMASQIAVPISAASEAIPRRRPSPPNDLRAISFGLLGPQAAGIIYRQNGSQRTEALPHGTGTYLIVQPLPASKNASELEGASGGTLGRFAPNHGELVTRVIYRLHGRLCERGPVDASVHLAHPCPPGAAPNPTELAQRRERRELHVPLHVHLQIRGGLVRWADVSFKAPYAIASARHYYSLFLPQPACHPRPAEAGIEGGDSIAIDHDVAAGQIVSARVIYPFLPIRDPCVKGRSTIEVVYQPAEGPPHTIVGKITLMQPPGTRGGPSAKPWR